MHSHQTRLKTSCIGEHVNPTCPSAAAAAAGTVVPAVAVVIVAVAAADLLHNADLYALRQPDWHPETNKDALGPIWHAE
jgi:hypothetical protein